ncbi:copper chaperone PCu(A)C [Ottowia testudinis]|uniref:Copper chaperone PCu(A)C n=1 Tax=Ottowia testudinis TaxID=2816950 RepID=A0A975CJ50_9BURK|nr:copper chaperone PCu(A)C [Ottowia testudinis]QTD45134.1 copper chaperone PCu(A)C [Ottowia testudinis]
MKRISLTLATLLLAGAAQAQVSIHDPWVRGTVPQQKATGLFMNIDAAQDVRLVAGQSPVAGVVEVHEMVMDGDVMKMREVKGGLEIAKGRTMNLKPGGYHVMLMELKQTLKGGDMVPVTLTFEDIASKKRFTQELKAPVTALGGGNAAPAMQHGKH